MGWLGREARDDRGEFYVRVSMDDDEGRYTWQLGGQISNYDDYQESSWTWD